MRLWKRLWCWVAGHAWVKNLRALPKAWNLAHLHPMAGCLGYCARCGAFWDDLPNSPPLEEVVARETKQKRKKRPQGDDPYRNPPENVPPLPKCTCQMGWVDPACPRKHEGAQKAKSKVATSSVGTVGFGGQTFIRIILNDEPVNLGTVEAAEVAKIVDDAFRDAREVMNSSMHQVEATVRDVFRQVDDICGKKVDRVERKTRKETPK